MTITAIILTKNEEDTIIDCIEALTFCDEVILIDDFSTDNTVSLARSYKNIPVTVIQRKLNENFSDQRNFGLAQAKSEWVLFVDADEIVSKKLSQEIEKSLSEDTKINGYNIPRKDIVLGKELNFGETGSMRTIRLAKKNAGKWEGVVHEQWNISGTVGSLENYLTHQPHKNISEFLTKINVYTTLRANELYVQKKKSNLFQILIYPFAKFIKNYILFKGYKDSTAGFVHAMLMSFHSFLVRGKLYLLWKGIKNTL
jgi:glycosyltransferase involved in cell wall biosynthesis